MGTKLSLWQLSVHSIYMCPHEYLSTITYYQLSYCLFNICWHLRPTLLRRERVMCPILFNQHIRLQSVSGIQLRNSMRPSSQFHPFEHKCFYCISFCAQIDSTWISNVDTHPSITSNITSIRAFKYNESHKCCAFTWHCYKQFVPRNKYVADSGKSNVPRIFITLSKCQHASTPFSFDSICFVHHPALPRPQWSNHV